MEKITKCKNCGADIQSDSKYCLKCGVFTPKPLYTKWIPLVIIVFIFIGFVGFIGLIGAIGSSSNTKPKATDTQEVSTSENTSKLDTTSKKEIEKLEIIGDVTDTRDTIGLYIEGIIKNNYGKDLSYVQITYSLFDKDGNQIGTATDIISNLEKDGKWKFKALGIDTDNKIVSYKLVEITGY